jgi:hypothetical protein
MWEVLLGTAAANKAVSVGIGLSVLLGAASTTEMTGIGPADRFADSPSHSSSEPADTMEPADEAPLLSRNRTGRQRQRPKSGGL